MLRLQYWECEFATDKIEPVLSLMNGTVYLAMSDVDVDGKPIGIWIVNHTTIDGKVDTTAGFLVGSLKQPAKKGKKKS